MSLILGGFSNMIEILRGYNFWDGQEIEVGYLRQASLDKLTGYLGNNLVKVIVGQRRCGKSYVMRMLIRHLIGNGVPPRNILYINCEMSALSSISTGADLVAVVDQWRKSLGVTGQAYVFVDEVQKIAGWETAVGSLSQDYTNRTEVFITGSNANLLGGELATHLGGRYITIEVFPFSYSEFCGITGRDKGRASFVDYLSHGGIPELFHLESPEVRRNYVSALRDSVILRDIMTRYRIREPYLLDRLVTFAVDSVGSLFSVNSIVKYLKAGGIVTNSETLGSYLGYLRDAFFLHEAERYDVKGRRILSGERKYYLNDTAFRTYLSSQFDNPVSRNLENAVYLCLRRRGYRVFTGTVAGREVDFIAERGQDRLYVQATWMLNDDAVISREFGSLRSIGDNYEKIVVSADDMSFGNLDGIRHIPAWEFVE